MLQRLVFATLVTVSLPSYAWEMPEIPSLQQQYEDAKVREVTEIFQTDPYFAGKIVDIEMFGRKIKVDRTSEPATTQATPTSGLASLTDILDGLGAEAKGNVGINVERKFTDEGILIYEKWGIVVGGEYKVKKEHLTPANEEKTTGEKR